VPEAEEEIWCAERRVEVAQYLIEQGLDHGTIGDRPAWHVAPYVSLWAIESLKSPGWVGWWAICGDLPTDYCSSENCRHPRLAVRTIAENWRLAVKSHKPGDVVLKPTDLPASLAPLLAERSKLLLAWARDDDLWPD
jgi:hypothetical protein